MAKFIKKINYKFKCIFLSLILLSSCTSSKISENSQADRSKEQNLTKITIAQYGHVLLYLPLYVAVQKDFFKKNGLEVTLVSTGGDEKTFTAVATGNAQFGVSDPTFTAIAREHGQGGKVVAVIVRGVPFWVVTLKPEIAPFLKPENFDGYRCAAFTAPSTSYAVMKRILTKGKANKAKIIQGAFGSLPAMLKSGQADLAIEIEPTVALLVGEGGHIIYSPQKELGDFAFTGLEVSDTYAKEHPQEIRACVKSIKEAMEYIHKNFDDSVELAQKEFPDVKPEIVKDAVARLKDSGTIPSNPYLPKNAWDAAIKLRQELGDLKSSGSYEENVDMSYVENK